MPSRGRVEGKVALISGGASGIGAATARRLAGEGARVFIADIQDGEPLAAAIVNGGGAASFVHLDVTSEENWRGVTDTIMAQQGRLDIAVNCAGVTVYRHTFPSEASFEEWRRVIAVNLDGVFLGTRYALAAMRASRPVAGSIVNISSILGITGAAGVGAYCASKGGVRSYTKSVALSCAEEGLAVRVNSVHPGFIDTPLLQSALERSNDVEEARRRYDALQPVGHVGTPEDVAHGVLYLASDESKFVTGAELVIDGGYTAR